MTHLFVPSTLKISFAQTGPGAFSEEDIRRTVVRDNNGRPIALEMPENLVLIANHQVDIGLIAVRLPLTSCRCMQIGGTSGV